jgi:hypothetical protein
MSRAPTLLARLLVFVRADRQFLNGENANLPANLRSFAGALNEWKMTIAIEVKSQPWNRPVACVRDETVETI